MQCEQASWSGTFAKVKNEARTNSAAGSERQEGFSVDVRYGRDDIGKFWNSVDAVLARHSRLQAVNSRHGPALALACDELCDDVGDASSNCGFLVDCSLGWHGGWRGMNRGEEETTDGTVGKLI